jgi:hypothetical protein
MDINLSPEEAYLTLTALHELFMQTQDDQVISPGRKLEMLDRLSRLHAKVDALLVPQDYVFTVTGEVVEGCTCKDVAIARFKDLYAWDKHLSLVSDTTVVPCSA